MIDEAAVEWSVVRDQVGVANKLQQGVADIRMVKFRLVGEEAQRNAVDPLRLGIDLPFGMDLAVEGAAGRQIVEQFDTADFDKAMAGLGVEPGGFGV